MEPIYRQQFEISTIHLDCFGRMKPSMILYFAQEVAGSHCDQLGCNWEAMAAKGLFWAVIRHRIQINRLPCFGETITIETWPMPTTKTCYPRSMEARDQDGNLLFQVHSLWVIMDVASRAMVLPGKSGVEVNGILRGTELPTPPSIAPKAMEHTITRRVGFSELDRNGHMNNVRYLDWVNDLLGSDFHRKNTPKEICLCYVNEAREGAELSLAWTQGEDNVLRVEVTDSNLNKRIFGASVNYA